MNHSRRTYLATCATAVAGTAGCLGGSSQPDGYAPDSVVPEETPTPSGVSTDSFDTTVSEGQAVPLVPVDVAYNWYVRRAARFVDARGRGQYDREHVSGAVHSPAEHGLDSGDPVEKWPKDQRIVTYCRCPHHLSSLRAQRLIKDGWENVYAIDEGFGAWINIGYPTSGSEVSSNAYQIVGESDPSDAGKYAWALADDGDQMEAVPIQSDGSYEMTLHFGGLSRSTPITVKTPSYELTAPLSEVTSQVVTGP